MKTDNNSLHLSKGPWFQWSLVGLITAILYIPLLLYGGIITDDWGDIRQTLDCMGFVQCYQSWLPLFSNRPLAPLPITLSTKLFHTHYSLYLLTNTTIYLIAVALSASIFKPFLSSFTRGLFFLLAISPCIALPLIASPINQLTATVAFLYWAISLKFLLAYERQNRWMFYIFAYLFLLFGFLTYEIILPLLFFTAFLPALRNPQNLLKNALGYCLKYIVPILVVLTVILVWQKMIAPQIFEDVSRLRFNPDHIIRNLHTWISVFTSQLPHLFIKSVSYLAFIPVIIFALIGLLFWYGLSSKGYTNDTHQGKIFLTLSLLSWLSSSLIFILTDESAVSWGYQARGLSSTWFCFAIVIASLVQQSIMLPKLWRNFCVAMLYLLISFSIFTFYIQRDKYIESWSLQMHILQDALTLIQKQAVGPNASILANVPRYVPNHFNRELVYSQSWDFPAALALYAQDQIRGGIVVDSRGKDLQNLRIEGGLAMVNDQGKVDFANLWLYDFEPATNHGNLIRIRSPQELESLIAKWKQ